MKYPIVLLLLLIFGACTNNISEEEKKAVDDNVLIVTERTAEEKEDAAADVFCECINPDHRDAMASLGAAILKLPKGDCQVYEYFADVLDGIINIDDCQKDAVMVYQMSKALGYEKPEDMISPQNIQKFTAQLMAGMERRCIGTYTFMKARAEKGGFKMEEGKTPLESNGCQESADWYFQYVLTKNKRLAEEKKEQEEEE